MCLVLGLLVVLGLDLGLCGMVGMVGTVSSKGGKGIVDPSSPLTWNGLEAEA